MPRKKTKKDYIPDRPEEKAGCCEVPGCREPGQYRAPRSKERLNDYAWYCLDHIREYNQRWDFFKDMDRDDIEAFMKDAVTGHRPTWSRETHTRQQQFSQLQDALYEFLYLGQKAPKAAPPVSARIRKALALLDLDYPYTLKELKVQYRIMVKRHHPDVNKGNKQSEERFKKIAGAYKTLSEHLKK